MEMDWKHPEKAKRHYRKKKPFTRIHRKAGEEYAQGRRGKEQYKEWSEVKAWLSIRERWKHLYITCVPEGIRMNDDLEIQKRI